MTLSTSAPASKAGRAPARPDPSPPLSEEDRLEIQRALREHLPHYKLAPEPVHGDRPLGVARGLLWALALYAAAAVFAATVCWLVFGILN